MILSCHLWERGMPGSLCTSLFSYHLLLLCSFTSLHLSHISSDSLVWLWQGGVGVIVGKALGVAFHCRGESITPHGEENTRAFLLAKASSGQTQNIFRPACLQLTVFRGSLAQARRPLIACQCLWSSPKLRATCDGSKQSEKPHTWVADVAGRSYATNIYGSRP